MLKINKIHVNKINEESELGNSRLELKILGNNINYIIINTLRRIILSDIPIYAFTKFKFDKNSSIFHNNYLKLRLSSLPVWGIENEIEYMDLDDNKPEAGNIYTNENDNDDITLDYLDSNENTLNSSSLKQLTMYVVYKNKTNNIVSVTTNDAKFYYDEKQINSPYKNNIQLIKLQPDQEIAFSAITTLGTEKEDAIFSPVSIATYKEITPTEFIFILESRGQLSEIRILKVAIINIQRKIKNFLKLFIDNKIKLDQIDDSSQDEFIEGMIEVHNEDHTLGNLITRGLQQHEDVKFAGYNLIHPLDKIIIFHYKIKKKTKIINLIEDIINYYNNIFIILYKELNNL